MMRRMRTLCISLERENVRLTNCRENQVNGISYIENQVNGTSYIKLLYNPRVNIVFSIQYSMGIPSLLLCTIIFFSVTFPCMILFCFFPPSPITFLMGCLRVFSLERSTVAAFAVPFRVLSRQKYDRSYSIINWFLILSHSLLIRPIRQLICVLKSVSLRSGKKFQELAHKAGS